MSKPRSLSVLHKQLSVETRQIVKIKHIAKNQDIFGKNACTTFDTKKGTITAQKWYKIGTKLYSKMVQKMGKYGKSENCQKTGYDFQKP